MRGLVLANVYYRTKFEACIWYTLLSYLTLKDIVKDGLGVTKIIGNGFVRKLRHDFLFALHSNYGPLLYHFRDKTRYWSNIGMA